MSVKYSCYNDNREDREYSIVDKCGCRMKYFNRVLFFSSVEEAVNWVQCGHVWPKDYLKDSGTYILNEGTNQGYDVLTGKAFLNE